MNIQVKNVSYTYSEGGPFQKKALDDLSFTIPSGQFTAIIGHTGSGKSTLMQLLNGLLKPTNGKIIIGEIDIAQKGVSLKTLRFQVGLVFQYPEYQLFEETVYRDIAYGPTNMKLSKNEIDMRIEEACALAGVPKTLLDKSPFDLSGGQKRRVAIASVLAMKPDILILDEPTAGLDPRGREEILHQIKRLHSQTNMTVLLVSHSMEDVARFAERILVLHKGKLILDGTPANVFREQELLEQTGLSVPQITQLAKGLKERGIPISDEIFTVDQAVEVLFPLLWAKGGKSE